MGQTKLCFVTHTFLPHIGGIERVVYEQSRRLQQKNFDPTVLTHKNYTKPTYNYKGVNVQCYDSLNIGFRIGIPYPIPYIHSYKTFLNTIKNSNLIHAHGHPYISSYIAAKTAKKYQKPFILTQHNTFIQYKPPWNTLETLNDNLIGKKIIKTAQKIIVISKATKKYVTDLGANPNKVELLYNGVDLNRFKLKPNVKQKIRQKTNIPQNATVAITVRRLVYKNGIDKLLECAQAATKQNPNLYFLVVGSGPDKEPIKAKIKNLQIEKKFILTGYIPDQELPDYYNAADFFILPSNSGEGLPLVVLEAMACGLQVIATNVGGLPEVMIPGYGKLIPPNSTQTMTEATLEFAEKDHNATKEKLRSEIEKRFSWEKNVNRMVEIYEEFI